MQILMSFAGIALILLLAFLLSTDKKAIRLRVVGAAFALQAGIAGLVLATDWGARVLEWMASGVSSLLGYSAAGTQFISHWTMGCGNDNLMGRGVTVSHSHRPSRRWRRSGS